MEAIILAGGLGTRLSSKVNQLPKSMAPVNERPFLEYQLDFLAANGFKKVILAVGYLHEHILRHFGATYKSLQLSYSIEKKRLGTGGAIVLALEKISDHHVFILNGDSLFLAGLKKMAQQSQLSELTMGVKWLPDTSRYGTVRFDRDGTILGYKEKGTVVDGGYINGGIYYVATSFLHNLQQPEAFSFEKEILEKEYLNHTFKAMPFEGYFLDIGIPEDYKKAQHEFKKLEY